MGRIDLVEPWAIRNLRKNVRESMQAHGEEVIALRSYHTVLDGNTQERCHCWNDIYNQSERFDCPDCYGTTFAGGIKQALRTWAIFTTSTDVEKKGKRGEWQSDSRNVQFEASLGLTQNDFLIRVNKWTPDHRPLELGGRYVLGPVTDEALRTGNQIGQTPEDLTGQSARVNYLKDTHPIYRYEVPSDLYVPQAEDLPAPWEHVPEWFLGEGPPTEINTLGSRPGDRYMDVLTKEKYTLGADNA